MKEIKAEKIISNFIWRFLERTGAQIVQFVVSIVIARLLTPNEYGTVALVVVIANVLQVFVDSGLANSLIQKKEVDDLDFSSVFYTNIALCLLIYTITFALAPLIGSFYNNVELVPVIRVLCLTIVISGFKNVQQAYVSRNLMFKKFFWATIIGTIVSAICGVGLAYGGYGIWALVAQRLLNLGIDTFMLWIFVKWRPKKIFSINRVKVLFGFGYKLMLSSLIDTVYNNIRQIIIGKVYSEDDLAFYNQGNQYPAVLALTINNSIDGVLFPVLSQMQDDSSRLKDVLRRSIQVATFFLAPIMLGIAAVGNNMIKLLLTEKWLPAVPYLQLFCVMYMFYPIHTANLSAINAQGRSDIFLKLEIVKKTIGIALIFFTLKRGVFVIAIGELVASFIGQIINVYPNKKLLGYSYVQQMIDIFPNIINAFIMFVISWLFRNTFESTVLNLFVQVGFGIVTYFCLIILTKNKTYYYVLEKLKKGKKHE